VAGGGGGAAHDGGRGEPDEGDRAAHEHSARRPGGAGHHPRRYRRYGSRSPVAADPTAILVSLIAISNVIRCQLLFFTI
jgi:hypothetical protein